MKKKWTIPQILILVISLAMLTGCGLYLYNRFESKNRTNAGEKYISASREEFQVDWNTLKAQNPNVVGWIYIPDTDISFPVVYSGDNWFYLDHDFSGAYNELGAVFLDGDLSPELTQNNTIVYGHSVAWLGGMFTSLSNFLDADYFNKHPVFYYLTPEQNWECRTFVATKCEPESIFYRTIFGENGRSVLQEMEDSATLVNRDVYRKYIESSYADDVNSEQIKMFSLSTCNLEFGLYSNQRIVISGKMTKTAVVPK